MLKTDYLNEVIYQWTVWLWPNHLVEAYTSPLSFQNLLKVTYRLNIPGRTLSPLSILHRTVSIECIHREGPFHKRYGIACTSLGSVIVTIRSSSPFPPSLCLRGGQGSFFAALCGSVCVFDCGKISQLSVRVPRSLDWLFPWGPPGSERLSPTILLPATPSGSSDSWSPLPCLVSPKSLV